METLNIILSYIGVLLWVFGLYLVIFSHLRGLLGRAFIVMWKKKYLWLFGIFAGLSAYGGEVNFFYQRLDTVGSIKGLLQGLHDGLVDGTINRVFSTAKTLWMHNAGQLSAYTGVIIAIGAVLFWLVIMSQGALIRIIGRLQQDNPTGLVDGLVAGTEKFWSLVQLNILGIMFSLASWVILTAVPAAIYLLTNNNAWSLVAYVGALVAIVVSIVIIFVIQFSTAGIVLNEAKLIPAIIDGWRLLTKNVLASVEMGIAVFTVNIVVLSLVSAELFFFVNSSVSTVRGFLTVAGIVTIAYALLSTYSFTAWTIFYTKLVEGKTPSKLNQWSTKLANFASQKRAIS